jgi:hypothetical protein
LPVLRHIEAVKRGFRPYVLERDVGDIARTSWVRLDEADVITLYDGNITSVLYNLSEL